MRLIICEKPSVAKTVAGALGAAEQKNGYIQGDDLLVSWCVGHLVSMADAGSYDERFRKWQYEDLPILPEEWKYTLTPGKEKQFSVLQELMHRADVTELVNGCDAGREGELIFRFVYEQAGCDKPVKRLWISSMEDSAIREGYAAMRDGKAYDALYQSALCRARADWLVGINATRLFSVLYHKTLNVGRVLSPTLNLLVERDGKITTFKKEKYHIVHIGCGGALILADQGKRVFRRIINADQKDSETARSGGLKIVKPAQETDLFMDRALGRAGKDDGYTFPLQLPPDRIKPGHAGGGLICLKIMQVKVDRSGVVRHIRHVPQIELVADSAGIQANILIGAGDHVQIIGIHAEPGQIPALTGGHQQRPHKGAALPGKIGPGNLWPQVFFTVKAGGFSREDDAIPLSLPAPDQSRALLVVRVKQIFGLDPRPQSIHCLLNERQKIFGDDKHNLHEYPSFDPLAVPAHPEFPLLSAFPLNGKEALDQASSILLGGRRDRPPYTCQPFLYYITL